MLPHVAVFLIVIGWAQNNFSPLPFCFPPFFSVGTESFPMFCYIIELMREGGYSEKILAGILEGWTSLQLVFKYRR